jgi:hypothetical protein
MKVADWRDAAPDRSNRGWPSPLSHRPLVMMTVMVAATAEATATATEEESERRTWLIERVIGIQWVNRLLVLGLRSANPDPVMTSLAPGPTLRRPGIPVVISSRYDIGAEPGVSLGGC